VLRPGIREKFARDIETYEWAAAHLEALGGEAARLRPRAVIANFKRWTCANSTCGARRLPPRNWPRRCGLRRLPRARDRLGPHQWPGDDHRMDRRRQDQRHGRAARGRARHAELARRLVLAFLTQAISAGFFHADMHQGNLFVKADGTIAAIDFGIMGRINRQARQWLAEILYGLTTGNYRRVAEIHFEAQYVPSYHSVEEFATALRAVGEPMRGKPVSELSVGQMLDGLFAITRDFDMQTQPHLLLLQKTMVMVEGLATALDPDDQHVGRRRTLRAQLDARRTWPRSRQDRGSLSQAGCCAASSSAARD
jgi:ubiquinone biosynthesis protein